MDAHVEMHVDAQVEMHVDAQAFASEPAAGSRSEWRRSIRTSTIFGFTWGGKESPSTPQTMLAAGFLPSLQAMPSWQCLAAEVGQEQEGDGFQDEELAAKLG